MIPGSGKQRICGSLDFADGVGAPWLVLNGTYGSGKTHLANAVKVRLMERLLYQIPVLDDIKLFYVPRLLDTIRQGFDDGSYRDVEGRVLEAKYLILDDLGDAGRADPQRDLNASGTTPWAREEVTKLLSERYETGAPTMITTNHVRQEIEAMYGSRLASRLFGEATGQVRVVGLECGDYRRKK